MVSPDIDDMCKQALRRVNLQINVSAIEHSCAVESAHLKAMRDMNNRHLDLQSLLSARLRHAAKQIDRAYPLKRKEIS